MTADAGVDADTADFDRAIGEIADTDGDVIVVNYVEIRERDRCKGGDGRMHGGQVRPAAMHGRVVWADRPRSLKELVPAAAHGRVIRVGEAGEEDVFLPYGSLVCPAGATRSAENSGGGGHRSFAFYAPVNIYAASPDIGAEIERQLVTAGR